MPTETAHACGRHGGLREMMREEVAGSCGNPGGNPDVATRI